jgi:hypothetical protein
MLPALRLTQWNQGNSSMASDSVELGRWRRMQSLFGHAIRIDQARRGDYLEQQCGGDKEMREELEKLLDAFESGTEVIEMTIEQAANSFVGQLPEVSRASLIRTTGEDYRSHRLREAFACIETFFYHSARSQQGAADAGRALVLARLFGDAARGKTDLSSADGLRALGEQVPADDRDDAMAAALRRWLETISDGFADTDTS